MVDGRATEDDFPVSIDEKQFSFLMAELRRRSEGVREAGAFMLASRRNSDSRRVSSIAFYDDLDPDCLTGGINFSAVGYTTLGQVCRDRGEQVIADIHLHPRGWVEQSRTDSRNPMVAIAGHLATIAPNYGRDVTSPRQLGAHLKTAEGWVSYFGDDVDTVFVMVLDADRKMHAVGPPDIRQVLRAAARWLRHMISRNH